MKIFLSIILISLLVNINYVSAQDAKRFEVIRDSIIARYNRQDYTGIYNLADSSFKAKISQQKLENFLAGNFSTGRFISVTLAKETGENKEYILRGQARDVIMVIGLNSKGELNNFGLKNLPSVFRPISHIQSNNPKRTKFDLNVDSIAKAYFTFTNAAALSIGIIKDGKELTYHYGQPNKRKKALPNNKTGYQLASVSKTFTATLLAQAVLDNKVKLDDDIRQYLPGSYPNLEFNGKPITLMNLANHTALLPAIPPNLSAQQDFDPLSPSLHYTEELMYQALHKLKLQQEPGTSFNYSNMGMSLVGLILQRVYQKDYDHLLSQYLTGPLKMKNTSVVLNKKQKQRMAIPYSNNGNIVSLWGNDIDQPAGGISSTMSDMLKFLHAQINEINPAIKLSHKPSSNNMGLGWGTRTINGKRDIQHNGGGIAFRSNITLYPELNSGLVILMNNDCDQMVFNSLATALQRLISESK
ncbi:serine hydrolase [Pedobacter sp. Hv1]|uniref:serine hydrolase n=1 Tax=Pedobacter sp. Hv1 TaxID=1740090 RepID=UPI0006D8955F|nr:serine hydrolase [Pedobacter sp. Hv1]KQC02179.1 hypothetical protein AQF98_00985 [Pedobacter sp. Hv1]